MAKTKQKQSNPPAAKQKTISFSENKYFQWILFFAFLICTLSATTYKLEDDDFFWHLSTGRFIVQNGYVPDKDVFGYATSNAEWIPFEWGWDVISYGLFSAAGYVLVYAFRSLIFCLMFYFIFRLLQKFKVNSMTCFLLLGVLLFAMLNRISPRPHIFTYLFLSLLFYFLFSLKYFERDKYFKYLYLLPVMFLFWGNLHLGALTGILLLFIFIASEAAIYYKKIKQDSPPFTKSQLKKLTVIFAVSFVVLIINPHGISTYIYAFEHTNMKMLESIGEWLSPFSSKAEEGLVLVIYKVLLFASVIAFIYAYKKKDLTAGMVLAVMAVYSLRAIRFTIEYELIAVPLLAVSIDYFIKGFDKSSKLKFIYSNPAKAVLAVVFLFLAYQFRQDSFYITLQYNREAGIGASERYFPAKLIAFLKVNHIKGTPFNNFDTGGYMEWEIPGEKVFIDSRNLNDDIFDEYVSILTMKAGFKEKLSKYGVDYMYLFEPKLTRFPDIMRQSITEYFFNDYNWKLVYWDDESMLFLKNIPTYADVISKYEYKVFNPYTAIFNQKKFEENAVKNLPQAQKEIQRKVKEDPQGYFFQGMNTIVQKVLRK